MTSRVKQWMPLTVIVAVALAAAATMPWWIGRISCVAAEDDSEDSEAVVEARAARARLAELSKHDRLSELFATVATAVKPAVVEIRVSKKVKVGPPSQLPDGMKEFYERFFRDLPPELQRRFDGPEQRFFEQHGLGSGVIVEAEEGYVLTNHHVVRGASEVEIVLADKRTFEAEWIRNDPKSDLAVVKIDAENLVEAPLGDSDETRIGEWVLAIGAPRGLPQTVTAGIISAKGRRTGDTEMYQNYLQTDAAINRGNSGGPLVNMRGEVVGVNNAIVTYSGGNEGIGFAIPSNMAENIMTQLIESGEVTRGYLGVRIQNVDEKLAKSFELPHTRGALVAQVAEGSPAADAGLKEGDFITAIEDDEVADVNELRNAVARLRPDKKADFTVYRQGKKRTIPVKIGKQPDDMAAAFGEPAEPSTAAAESYGIEVASVTEDMLERFGYDKPIEGVVITEVRGGTDAADQGLRPGMVITHVNGKAITSPGQFQSALDDDGIRLRVTGPRGATRFVFITPEDD
ncbi:MAG: Do family serine endopeptidase [Phycisphaerae bacterium]|nr:Do family serine endopeptidase [Phycisphaerae bacterium]